MLALEGFPRRVVELVSLIVLAVVRPDLSQRSVLRFMRPVRFL